MVSPFYCNKNLKKKVILVYQAEGNCSRSRVNTRVAPHRSTSNCNNTIKHVCCSSCHNYKRCKTAKQTYGVRSCRPPSPLPPIQTEFMTSFQNIERCPLRPSACVGKGEQGLNVSGQTHRLATGVVLATILLGSLIPLATF